MSESDSTPSLEDKNKIPLYNQEQLDTLASTLYIKYQVEDNLTGGMNLYSVSITLTNHSSLTLGFCAGCSTSNQWSIYFSHLRMVEPNFLPMDPCVDLEYSGVRFSHVNGSIFKLSPLKSFQPLKCGESTKIKFNAQHYSASRSDILPNWYLHIDGTEPRLIKSTEGESLDFIGPFDTPKRYKRFDYTLTSGRRRYDIYQPFTPEVRFHRYLLASSSSSSQKDTQCELKPVIPTPHTIVIKDKSNCVDIFSEGWRICFPDSFFHREAEYLSEKTGILLEKGRLDSRNPEKVIAFTQEKVSSPDPALIESEAYRLEVDTTKQFVQISASTRAGAFYAVQTLLSLTSPQSSSSKNSSSPTISSCGNRLTIPSCTVHDAPRYSYRGMHVDISRNFQEKREILQLLDLMAAYKMNKFHFHLTDDEGWRLEIPGLEELTEVGSKRGHDLEENTCLLPLLGSGPFPHGLGCGYYSVEDYKEILRHANELHIEVIPEIDMPGHSHAAVRAMKVRYDRLMAKNKRKEAKQYLLSEPDLPAHSYAFSVQMLADNSMNPGLESTYAFVDKVIKELKEMHQEIQPLRVFHLGGDEVPYEAWDESPACLALVDSKKVDSMEDLMEYFVLRVAQQAYKHGLELGAWQDGIVVNKSEPYRRSKFANSKVSVYFWRNVWEKGQAYDAHKLANEGYEVILAPGTHFYFDHPHEPDPEERGLFWACRFVDTHKVFNFMPTNIMANADVKLTGEKLTKADLKAITESEDYTQLKKPENIKGLQGQIWTELVRTRQQFHEMICPRLIALAERAWHCASWEKQVADKRGKAQDEDWAKFAMTLGHKELKRMEAVDIPYHIPPPGARLSGDGHLEMLSCYPGLPLHYSVDQGNTWKVYESPVGLEAYHEILVRASSHNGRYHSRITKVDVKTYAESDEQGS
ncbi:beta-hexosaminidase [Plakobranchus ocellatus]|uniref:beta-N-acetylhexosaminidase n=1 Tax=Plakobranchus ocellatus TaxID=259542 RepID=A0AAV4B6J0_9GAST|nr:beta-hexosaminidase [Plakobranchus ocellatus]